MESTNLQAQLEKAVSEPSHNNQAFAHDPLEQWWVKTAVHDITKTAPKALAYGSRGEDLIEIGRNMATMTGMKTPEGVTDDQFHGELGCYFYLVGKLARAHEAFKNGLLPSEDTLFDISIYAAIHRRIRANGYWG